jgi:hypothetical protein
VPNGKFNFSLLIFTLKAVVATTGTGAPLLLRKATATAFFLPQCVLDVLQLH